MGQEKRCEFLIKNCQAYICICFQFRLKALYNLKFLMLFLLSTIMKENKNRLKDKYLDVMKKDNQKNKKNIK